jgi:competence protein ComGF
MIFWIKNIKNFQNFYCILLMYFIGKYIRKFIFLFWISKYTKNDNQQFFIDDYIVQQELSKN